MSEYRGRPCEVDTCEYVAPDSRHPSRLSRVDGRLACQDCREFYSDAGHWPDEQTTFGEVNPGP